MIVTRQRTKKKSRSPLLLPLIAIVALGVALVWPPSHNVIVNGPLRPLWGVAGSGWGVVSRPLTFAAQQEKITDGNRQIRTLSSQLEEARKTKVAAESRITALQRQIAAINAQPKVTPQPAPVLRATPAAAAGAAAAVGGAAAISADDKRTAATWAAMEPSAAAALIQKLPDAYVAHVLAAMDTDAAGDIMSALPAAAAARITRVAAATQVSSAANR